MGELFNVFSNNLFLWAMKCNYLLGISHRVIAGSFLKCHRFIHADMMCIFEETFWLFGN